MASPRLLGRRHATRPQQTIDRLAPMDRPDAIAAGFQTWRDILYLHWPIPADDLREHVPERLSIDRFDGKAYVSIVAFLSEDSRPFFAPKGTGFSWTELNVRTYVHLDGKEPGIYMLDVVSSSLLATLGIRFGQGIPVEQSRVDHRHENGQLSYTCERPMGARFSVACHLGARVGAAEPGTLDHFLLERYYLHVDRTGTLWTTRIHHAPLDLEHARVHEIEEQLVGSLGLPEREGHPLVHYAREVRTEYFIPKVRF